MVSVEDNEQGRGGRRQEPMSESLWEEKLEVVVLIMTGGGNSTRVLNFLLQVI